MPRDKVKRTDVDHGVIVDRIYEIALEPSLLDDFIDLWADSDLAEQFAQSDDGKPDAFDAFFKAHLERAGAFLRLGDTSLPDLEDHLKPYDTFAAFIVNQSLMVEATNPGAQAAFGVQAGDSLTSLDIPSDVQATLMRQTQDVLRRPECLERLLKAENETKQGAMLFRVIRIARTTNDSPAALVVSTHIHWRESIGTILNQAFDLTKAEQSVVRKLTEGQDVKSIATARGTAAGTVREQIKSIIGKMNVRSQTDIVRFALTLGEFPQERGTTKSDRPQPPLVTSAGWLENEVWKPFKSITLPDGRIMTYHDMGPQNGNPVLYSHMGSAMVRWPREMIQLAFRRNLRIICPIRAGYGHSDNLKADADVLDTINRDTVFLLQSLGIPRLPYAIHGTDFPFAADLIAKHPDLISELIGIGARPCSPNGLDVEGHGRWQRFFVWTARHNPRLVQFAAEAVMMMAKRIGPEAMLRQLCKDSPADLALLEIEEVKQILIANLNLMAGPSTNAARAFAMEYAAFHTDWSHLMQKMRHVPTQIFIAAEDPTIDIGAVSGLSSAYPWIKFEVIPDTGLALVYQKPEKLIPILADAAKRAKTVALPTKENGKPVFAGT